MWGLSSLTRDQTRVPCITRWILNHWTTREVPQRLFSGYNFHFGLNKDFHFFLRSTDEAFHHNDNVGNSKLLESAKCCAHYPGGLAAGWGLSAVSRVREQDSRERTPLKCSDLGFQGHRVMLRGGCSLGPFLGCLFISEIFLRPTSPRR